MIKRKKCIDCCVGLEIIDRFSEWNLLYCSDLIEYKISDNHLLRFYFCPDCGYKIDWSKLDSEK